MLKQFLDFLLDLEKKNTKIQISFAVHHLILHHKKTYICTHFLEGIRKTFLPICLIRNSHDCIQIYYCCYCYYYFFLWKFHKQTFPEIPSARFILRTTTKNYWFSAKNFVLYKKKKKIRNKIENNRGEKYDWFYTFFNTRKLLTTTSTHMKMYVSRQYKKIITEWWKYYTF